MGWMVNWKGFVWKASWWRFPVLGCKGGWGKGAGRSQQFLPQQT